MAFLICPLANSSGSLTSTITMGFPSAIIVCSFAPSTVIRSAATDRVTVNMVPITVTKPIKSLFFITGPSSLFRSTGARLLARISDFDGPSSSLSYTRIRQSERDSHRSLSHQYQDDLLAAAHAAALRAG